MVRGVISIEDPDSLLPLIRREHWVILCCQHYPTPPPHHPAVDVHQVDRMYVDACGPTPHVLAIPREFIDERVYRPLPGVVKDHDLLFNATWWAVKRPNLLLNALIHAKKSGRPISVLWYGYHWRQDGHELEKQCKRVAADNELDVTFLDTDWDAEENNRRYNRCRAALLCSTNESGPRVMSEAMLAGLPYLSAQDTYGGSVSYLDGHTNGLAFAPTPVGLCNAVWWTLDHLDSFTPRQWALTHMCKSVGMARLRLCLEELAIRKGWAINVEQLDYDGNTAGGWPERVAEVERELALS